FHVAEADLRLHHENNGTDQVSPGHDHQDAHYGVSVVLRRLKHGFSPVKRLGDPHQLLSRTGLLSMKDRGEWPCPNPSAGNGLPRKPSGLRKEREKALPGNTPGSGVVGQFGTGFIAASTPARATPARPGEPRLAR